MPRPFTVNSAQGFLTKNLLWALKRTRRLYVELSPHDPGLPTDRRIGFFEPVLLCLCWCDFLGALYLGEGFSNNERRIVQWFRGPMQKQNRLYRTQAGKIYRAYRNGLVHGFAPTWFYVSFDEPALHLADFKKNGVRIDFPTLLDDLVWAVRSYAAHLKSRLRRHGNVAAFNRGWVQVRRANK